jgi:hypothetical protein
VTEAGGPAGGLDDQVSALLDRLAERLRDRTRGGATVQREDVPGTGVAWHVWPDNPRSAAVGWLAWDDGLLLYIGVGNAQWELEGTAEDVRFVEEVARAVVAGRAVEVAAPGRVRAEVTLADGRVERTTTINAPFGLLPLPGWRRWGRKVRYEPYA